MTDAIGDPAGAASVAASHRFSGGLTHVDTAGAARMVDVSGKDVTVRSARAAGRVIVSAEVVGLLRDGRVAKGDALAVARIAGIQGAKRTPDLVPLCHPIALHGVRVDLEVVDDGVLINTQVRTADRTGVEMEALTAVVAAGLALIDMVKSVDRSAVITDVRLLEKSGGRSGTWARGYEADGVAVLEAFGDPHEIAAGAGSHEDN